MASTVLSYREHHVPVPEPPVIGVGYMLFHEAWLSAISPEDKSRFEQMTSEFTSRIIGVGCTKLGLDQLLQADPKKEAEFLTFVNLTRIRLLGFGKEVPPEYVNQVMAVNESAWQNHAWPTPWLHKVLDLIEALIRGGRLPPGNWLSNIRRGHFPSNRSRRQHRCQSQDTSRWVRGEGT